MTFTVQIVQVVALWSAISGLPLNHFDNNTCESLGEEADARIVFRIEVVSVLILSHEH